MILRRVPTRALLFAQVTIRRHNTVLICTENLDESDEIRHLSARVQDDGFDLLKALELKDKELSLVLCNDAFIRDLNTEYRNMDSATDVLSFPLDHEMMLGDVIISVETAQRQAEERDNNLQDRYVTSDEIRVLLVHGVLHLIGFDHELGDEEYASMAAAEQEAMHKLNWKGMGLIDGSEHL